MGTGKRIQILLSTFNGEKYLREQLDSFTQQSVFEQISVLIRDDGSKDATRSILEEYRSKYGFQLAFGENIGVNASYQWLIDHADSNCGYYALSDQDDVWLPDKIERAVRRLDAEDENIPLLYASRSVITDAQLRQTGFSQDAVRGTDFYNAMLQNVCPGHTQVFNQLTLIYLQAHQSTQTVVFDWWVYLVAAGMGKVCFDAKPTVYHRQHGGNAIGYGTSFWTLLGPRLKRLVHGDSSKMTCQLRQYYEAYAERLPEKYSEELSAFLESMNSISSRIHYLRHCRVYRQTGTETAAFKAYYLTGRYKIENSGK